MEDDERSNDFCGESGVEVHLAFAGEGGGWERSSRKEPSKSGRD